MVSTYTSYDTIRAYLFECDDDGLFAISLDPTGENIPKHYCLQGWTFREEFALGVHEPMPVAIAPEAVLQSLRKVGYYVWRQGRKH